MKKHRRKHGEKPQTYGGGLQATATKLGCGFLATVALLLVGLVSGGLLSGGDFGVQWYKKRVEKKHKAFFDAARTTLSDAEKRAGQWLNNICGISIAAGIIGCVPGGVCLIKEETVSGWQAAQDISVACCGLFGGVMALHQVLALGLALQMRSSYSRLMQANALAMPCSLRGLYTELIVALGCLGYALVSLLLR